MPGFTLRIWNVSWVTVELSSAVEPLRITITLSGWPVDVSAERSPSTSAKMLSSTATVSAMPSAVMIVVVRRATRFRRL